MTSFKKAGRPKTTYPRGTKPSLHNSQLLISSGTPSLDALLGGLAIGSVLLVEEDAYNLYAKFLIKYFLAEGVMCGHALYVAGPSVNTGRILKELPASVGDGSAAAPPAEHNASQPKMDIAWRYQNLPTVKSGFSNNFGHFYDLSKTMEQARIDQVPITVLDTATMHCHDSVLQNLSQEISKTINLGNYGTSISTPSDRNVLRLVIESFGSPLWGTEHNDIVLLCRFLHNLRALVRSAYAVAVVTVPNHLLQDEVCVRKLERLCDAAVALESFSGSSKDENPLYRDYHGLFHIHKLPCLNCLVPQYPETLELGFKLHRKKFAIEKLHLPPELSETANRAQEDVVKKSTQHVPSKYNIDF
ncbi:elongator complex protein 4-like [Dysidea avara]|uniref:elongator complex protein 4-like n=1 Tax=Dysidea avara TaxID=196820 RepID=UPI00332B7008